MQELQENLNNIIFYMKQGAINTLTMLKKPEYIRGLKNERYCYWIDPNYQKCLILRQILTQKKDLLTLGDHLFTIDGLLQELSIKQKQNSNFYCHIICTDFNLLLQLQRRCSTLKCIGYFYCFSIIDNQNQIKNGQKLKRTGKINYNKFKIINGGYSGFQKTLIQQNVLPNFIFLGHQAHKSNMLKHTLNTFRYSQLYREQAIKNYGKLMEMNISAQQYQKCDQLIQKYKAKGYQSLPSQQILRMYTQQSFFYKKLNILLKKTLDPRQLFYMQFLVKDFYQAIKQKYLAQTKNDRGKRRFQCYRGATFSKQQFIEFQNNVGNCVQCLGFLSTSILQTVAEGFGSNTKIIITVNDTKRDQFTNYGYVFMEYISTIKDEKQVLFNMLNSFTVQSAQQIDNRYVIKLEYGTLAQMKYKKNKGLKLAQHQQKIKNLACLQQNQLIVSYFQVQCFFYNEIWQIVPECLRYGILYCQKFDKKFLQLINIQNQNRKMTFHYFFQAKMRLVKIFIDKRLYQKADKNLKMLQDIYHQFRNQFQQNYKISMYTSILQYKVQIQIRYCKFQQALQTTNIFEQQANKTILISKIYLQIKFYKIQCYFGLLKFQQVSNCIESMKNIIQNRQPTNHYLWNMYRIAKLFYLFFTKQKNTRIRQQIQQISRCHLGSRITLNRITVAYKLYQPQYLDYFLQFIDKQFNKDINLSMLNFTDSGLLVFLNVALLKISKLKKHHQIPQKKQILKQITTYIQQVSYYQRQQLFYFTALQQLYKILIKMKNYKQAGYYCQKYIHQKQQYLYKCITRGSQIQKQKQYREFGLAFLMYYKLLLCQNYKQQAQQLLQSIQNMLSLNIFGLNYYIKQAKMFKFMKQKVQNQQYHVFIQLRYNICNTYQYLCKNDMSKYQQFMLNILLMQQFYIGNKNKNYQKYLILNRICFMPDLQMLQYIKYKIEKQEYQYALRFLQLQRYMLEYQKLQNIEIGIDNNNNKQYNQILILNYQMQSTVHLLMENQKQAIFYDFQSKQLLNQTQQLNNEIKIFIKQDLGYITQFYQQEQRRRIQRQNQQEEQRKRKQKEKEQEQQRKRIQRQKQQQQQQQRKRAQNNNIVKPNPHINIQVNQNINISSENNQYQDFINVNELNKNKQMNKNKYKEIIVQKGNNCQCAIF